MWHYSVLRAALLTGAGIGLTLPVQSGVAVASLPPARLALGSAVASSFRQLGAVLGVSIFVAILATSAPAHTLTACHRAWWVFAALSSQRCRGGHPAAPPEHLTSVNPETDRFSFPENRVILAA